MKNFNIVVVQLEVHCAYDRGVCHSCIQQFSIAVTLTTYSDDGQSRVGHAVGDHPVRNLVTSLRYHALNSSHHLLQPLSAGAGYFTQFSY